MERPRRARVASSICASSRSVTGPRGLAAVAGLGALLCCPPLSAQGLVQNPSFELTYNPEWPHYAVGEIPSWAYVGGSGTNDVLSDPTGPFHNPGTAVPDRDRIAFKQGGGSLSQTILGLVPGERYWVQVWYDARACCGGTIQAIRILWNGETIDSIPGVVPAVGAPAVYHFRNAAFTPDAETGTLTFEIAIDGDATALLDAVTIVRRDEGNVVVANPSFEASGPPTAGIAFPEALHSGELFTEPAGQPPANLAGWTASALEGHEGVKYGISLIGGAYADNGAIPDQDLVGFLEGPGSFSQAVSGLVPGTTYDLSFAYNARSGTAPRLQVLVDDAPLFEEDVAPVGGGSPYRTETVSFTAGAATATIAFAQIAETDETLLLDDVRIVGQVVEDVPIDMAPTSAELSPTQRIAVEATTPGSTSPPGRSTSSSRWTGRTGPSSSTPT